MSEPDPNVPKGDTWQGSLSEFLGARLGLIRLEIREAGQQFGRKAALGLVALAGGLFFYLLLLAGLIGWIASLEYQWPWYFIALAGAGLHLLLALVAVRALKKPAPEAFQITRSELAKDRAWLEQLKQNPKSPL